MTPRSGTAQRHSGLLLWLLIAAALIGWMPLALGATAQTLRPATCTAGSANLSIGSVSVPPNTTSGTKIGPVATTSITFTCSNLPVTSNGKTDGTVSTADRTATIQAGENLAALDSTNNPAGPGITFATNVPGIALLLNASPVPASSRSGGDPGQDGPDSLPGYPVGSITGPTRTPQTCTAKHGKTTCTFTCTTGNNANTSGCFAGTVTESFNAQLIVTGPVTPGTINSIQLTPFWWYIAGGDQDSASKKIAGSVLTLNPATVTVPACAVSAASKNLSVTLPTVSTSALSAAGRATGRTAFKIALTNCPSGVTSMASFFSSPNIDTGTGNLKNTGSGAAANVEIQLLNGNGGSATPFSTINLAGTSVTTQNSGTYNVAGGGATLNYYAQYIANGAAAGTGSVNSSVMYTITYP
jgi:type 1 fimbria pilin